MTKILIKSHDMHKGVWLHTQLSSKRDTTKPELWTLDWTMDWTLDSIMDSRIGLKFQSPQG